MMCWNIFFLVCINLMTPSMPLSQELRKAWPDITHFRKKTNWCERMSVEFQQKLRQQGNCTTNHAHCQKSLQLVMC